MGDQLTFSVHSFCILVVQVGSTTRKRAGSRSLCSWSLRSAHIKWAGQDPSSSSRHFSGRCWSGMGYGDTRLTLSTRSSSESATDTAPSSLGQKCSSPSCQENCRFMVFFTMGQFYVNVLKHYNTSKDFCLTKTRSPRRPLGVFVLLPVTWGNMSSARLQERLHVLTGSGNCRYATADYNSPPTLLPTNCTLRTKQCFGVYSYSNPLR